MKVGEVLRGLEDVEAYLRSLVHIPGCDRVFACPLTCCRRWEELDFFTASMWTLANDIKWFRNSEPPWAKMAADDISAVILAHASALDLHPIDKWKECRDKLMSLRRDILKHIS